MGDLAVAPDIALATSSSERGEAWHSGQPLHDARVVTEVGIELTSSVTLESLLRQEGQEV